MGFCEILTIVFVVLKLVGTIDWSWWLVLLPEIIALIFYIGCVIAHTVLSIQIVKLEKDIFGKRRHLR